MSKTEKYPTCEQRCMAQLSARPTNDISIELEIQQHFVMILFIIYSADHNGILHTSRQIHYHNVRKILLWSVDHILKHSTPKFDRISSSVEIPLDDGCHIMQTTLAKCDNDKTFKKVTPGRFGI